MGYFVLHKEGDWWSYVKANSINDLQQVLTDDYPGELDEAEVFVLEFDIENAESYEIISKSRYEMKVTDDDSKS